MMRRSRIEAISGLFVLVAALGVSACAASARHAGHLQADTDALGGWRALAEGRPAEADAAFARVLASRSDDAIALVGRAALAYERGATARAVEDDVAALVDMVAERSPAKSGAAAGLAPVAAGQLATLYGELSVAARAGLLERLRPAELARSAALPWTARLELARLAEHAARVDAAAERLARDGEALGCARRVFDAGTVGPLPRLDLDGPAPASRSAEWRPVVESGCRLDLAADSAGLGGARVLHASIEVSGGRYLVIIDYDGPARLSVDGGPPGAHGSLDRYGPRASAFAATLGPGRHDLELRLATDAGSGELSWLVFPDTAGRPVTFVDPRSGLGPAKPQATSTLAPVAPFEGSAGAAAEGGALADYAEAYGALRIGAFDAALEAAARLRARPRFPLGLALAAAVLRADPSRPPALARDEARRLLRAAVAGDPSFSRAFQDLAALELEEDRPREAIDAARAAVQAAPAWWSSELSLARALAVRGLDLDAERATLAAAEKAGASATPAAAPCPLVEAMRRRADDRRMLADETRWAEALAACGVDLEARIDRLREAGQLEAALALGRQALAAEPTRDDLVETVVALLTATGRRSEAVAELTAWVARAPGNPTWALRLADVQAADGRGAEARSIVARLVETRPDLVEARRAARALGVPLPTDAHRVDGRAAIRAFERSGERYSGPAVVVLDQSVMAVLPSGARLTLTHEIVRLDSKDALDRWGEVSVPSGAEVLTLRTHKPDGTTREPEEIAGKETISAADLAIGDYLEWELLESDPPAAPFAPGFLTDRFYFQSFDAPLARSELVLLTPAALPIQFDRRGAAPAPETHVESDGTRVTRFVAKGIPQLFAERAAVPAVDYVPSVRASSGVGWRLWGRYIADQLADATRSTPELRATARELAAAAGPDRAARAAAIVSFVTERIESDEGFAEPASHTLHRGSGSRIPLALALAREMGVPARPVLARATSVADAASGTPVQELDDFGDTLLELDVGGAVGKRYADLSLRHAPFGYLPPGLDGARTLVVPEGEFGLARSTAGEDLRTVDLHIRLDGHGGGVATAREQLTGWPALEWAELLDRLGEDKARLRQDFEQRWLGVQFPGARLDDLQVELSRDRAGHVGAASVRYAFASAQLARAGGPRGPGEEPEIRIQPTFFRSQPGRRFATEARRSTPLVLGFDVPLRLTATLELPSGAHVDPGTLRRDAVVARPGAYRFFEAREGRPATPARPGALILRREWGLPIVRVAPREYPSVAADLRQVDRLEQEEIRVPLGRGTRGAGR